MWQDRKMSIIKTLNNNIKCIHLITTAPSHLLILVRYINAVTYLITSATATSIAVWFLEELVG